MSGKGETIRDLPDGVWGFTETHVTQAGSHRLRQELKCVDPSLNFVHGAFATPISQNTSTIGGKATGVAMVSRHPIRAMVGKLQTKSWDSARILTANAFCGNAWLKVGVLYGFASKPKSQATREATDDLLAQLVERLAYQQYGYRVIMGDFNQGTDTLPQCDILRRQGWVEIQEYGREKWGRDIVPTCRRTSVVDQLWLSPELQPLLRSIVVDDTIFPDHGILFGQFDDFGTPTPFYVWPKPASLPWDEVNWDLEVSAELSSGPVQQATIPDIFAMLEDRVHTNLRAQGKQGLLAQQKGRCKAVKPKLCLRPITPTRPSRPSEVQVEYLGEHYQHSKWTRQLRRLQSLCHIMHSPKTTQACIAHKHQLWEAIRAAPGFPGGFAHMWKHRAIVAHGDPPVISRNLPSPGEVDCIFHGFLREYRALEKMLNQARLVKARARRVADRTLIFRDVAAPKSLPIHTLVEKKAATVQSVSSDGLEVQVASSGLVEGFPISSPDRLLCVRDIQGEVVHLHEPAMLEPGTILLQEQCVDDLDIRLDLPKTWFWSLLAGERKTLRDQGHVVKLAERDLGGHLQLCKQSTNFTIRSRTKSLGMLWTWLSRSPSPMDQKLQCLHTVAWPKVFHGIATVLLGDTHFASLRSSAMAALKWDKKGASSVIQFGLVTPALCDPGFYVVWDTIAKFRAFAVEDIAFPLLDHLVETSPARYHPGPCGVLLTRLHLIMWQWQGSGYVLDHEGLQIHLFDTPIQYLRFRVEHAWSMKVGAEVSTRQEFQGMQQVDAKLTQCGFPGHSAENQGLLRVILNGTFCTRNKQVHTGKVSSDLCPWCNAADSIHHRHWECPHFEDIRHQVPSSVLTRILEAPECTRLHGWCVQSHEDRQFRRELLAIPDTTGDFSPVPVEAGALQLFTDGSCLEPKVPALRLATWGVIVGNLQSRTFHPLRCGGVTGGYHTVTRAEILAAISACRFSLHVGHQFCLWTDNKAVHKFLLQCKLTPTVVRTVSRSRNDHDLWNELGSLSYRCLVRGLFLHVFKVTSHQVVSADTPEVEQWAFEGNEAADQLASRARDLLPSGVLQAWTRFSQVYHSRMEMKHWLHTVFLAVGKRAVECKEVIQVLDSDVQQDRIYRPQPPLSSTPVSFAELPDEPNLDLVHHMGECHQEIFRWVSTVIHQPGATPVWVSSYQLLALFQQHTGYLGVKYVPRLKGYIWLHFPQDHDTYNFVRIAAWLMALVKCLARSYAVTCSVQDQIPVGTSFKVWARCLFLPISGELLTMLDRRLLARGVVPITRLQRQLGSLEPFFDEA
eukprot:Skav227916  [mRNA]  locus=scaffold146:145928:150717:+ [translate_table: standard]